MSSSRLHPPSDASRPRSGILTPSSDGSLNQGCQDAGGAGSDPRKRKRGSHALEDLLKPSIVLKPHPSNIHTKPRVLQPIMVLPRMSLPLSCLDLSSPRGDLPPSQFHESHIRILDLESRRCGMPVVLVVRNEATGNSYAIETYDAGLVTACKLGSWADLESLSGEATLCSRQVLARIARPTGSVTARDGLPLPVMTPGLHKAHKEKKAAIEAIQSLVRKRARSQSVALVDEAAGHARALLAASTSNSRSQTPAPQGNGTDQERSQIDGETQPRETSQVAPEGEPSEQKTASDIFENIQSQYTEALYRSMGSLAYFAKGPLSRARAAFHLDCDSTLNMDDLIDFLKSLVMTTVQIDTKYRTSIPEIISSMQSHFDSSDEARRKKKRKSRRAKMGKDGLYPMEDEEVRKWWMANKPELQGDQASTSPQQIRSHLDLLRTRETQMQMIIILEILALAPLRAADDEGDNQLPGLPGKSVSPAAMAPPPTKKRSKHNLPVLADVHADRLCIWHSTASDELLLLEDSQGARQAGEGARAKTASSEPLRDFCVDVIMPFFSPRLPELCDAINRKLGGPVIVSPPSAKQPRGPGSAKEAKPGAPAKRPAPLKPKTLQRALSNEQQQSRRSVSRGPSNALALLRSATSTTIPGLKREASEPLSLKNMIMTEAGLGSERPRLLSRSNSIASVDDSKAKKQALVDAELHDAITALRKPNRELAGKALVEAAERRASGSLSLTRKSKKPTRNPLFQAVQVKATPVNNRYRDALASESQGAGKPFGLPQLFADDDLAPPSSASVIPSTAPRPSHRDALSAASQASNTVAATPVRKSTGPNPFLHVAAAAPEESAIPQSSPLMARKASDANRPSIPASVARNRSVLAAQTSADESDTGGLFETPVKQRMTKLDTTENNVADFTALGKDQVAAPDDSKKMTIYQRLGWDDDLDDLA